MNRLINYVFGLIVIYLFILEAGMYDHARILTGLALSALLSCVAFLGNWITLDATKSVIIIGTVILGFGGWILAFAVIFFFVSSSLLTRNKRVQGVVDPEKLRMAPHLQKRRDAYQVWANGFWVCLFAIAWFLFPLEGFLIAAFAAVATATADTWATEIGLIRPGKTWCIKSLEPVEAGTDGGISLKGSVAAVAGCAAISLFVITLFPATGIPLFLIVFLAGVFGCLADSWLGAQLVNREFKAPESLNISLPPETFKNSYVNWISTGIGAFTALLITQLLLL